MQTKSYAADADDADTADDADADADADGIHTKNNMSPTPSEGGHNSILGLFNCFCKSAACRQLETKVKFSPPRFLEWEPFSDCAFS